jgi:hypothetical protein
VKKALGERLMGEAIPKGSIVYIRYKDHVLFQNTAEALENADERETIGWLTQETGKLICVQHDRTLESIRYASGKASGLVILKSHILEIRALPLQKSSNWPLISRNDMCENGERVKAANTVHR